ncbi:TetR/AcrR family transcriptional regulator [Acerihabitans arboris]|uniref:TetR family transcriptional regulator n=1 Tax=Acerihabitans arboris TaxID=2691583 RepID=A0A845SIG7_9GAMM|nr:TetR/AcrR family transcriptional regulator [Acerihabitans arboris]NDL62826.1 TetR family transcriptional regulator [Acerihabitans arboris]
MNPHQAEHAALIAQIAEIFRHCGYEGASLSRITERTGLGKGSLYHFFPGGKDAMAAAALAQVDDWFRRRIFQPLERDSAPGAINGMWDAVDEYFLSGQRICLMGAFALDGTRDRFTDAIGAYFTRWISALQRALERAGVDGPAAGELAEDTVAGIQGALTLARALNDNGQFVRSARRLRGRLARYL